MHTTDDCPIQSVQSVHLGLQVVSEVVKTQYIRGGQKSEYRDMLDNFME